MQVTPSTYELEFVRSKPSSSNKLLATLPPEDYRRVREQMTVVPMKHRQILYKQGQTIRDVYFPGGGLCSMIKIMDDGAMVEIANAGSDGMIGAWAYLGDDRSTAEVVVQIDSPDALKMPIEAFRAEMERRGALYNRVSRYAQALASHVIQMTACNGIHSLEQRCCRWLLTARDRAGRDDLKLTHEFLAIALGVRRASVTLAIGGLQKAGLIEGGRGMIRITDGPGLERVSCECYSTVKDAFHRFLPEIGDTGSSRLAALTS